MANIIGNGKDRHLVDSDGDALDDGAGKLNVNTVGSSLETGAYLTVDASNETLVTEGSIESRTDCKEIILQADEDNSGYIMVGDTNISVTQGIKLNPGDTLTLTISSTALVYVRGSTSGQKLRVLLIRG